MAGGIWAGMVGPAVISAESRARLRQFTGSSMQLCRKESRARNESVAEGHGEHPIQTVCSPGRGRGVSFLLALPCESCSSPTSAH